MKYYFSLRDSKAQKIKIQNFASAVNKSRNMLGLWDASTIIFTKLKNVGFYGITEE